MSIQIHYGCKLNCRPNKMLDMVKSIRNEMSPILRDIVKAELAALISEFCCTLSQYPITKESIQTILKEFMPECSTETELSEACSYLKRSTNMFITFIAHKWMQAFQKQPPMEFQHQNFDVALRLFLFPTASGVVYCLPSGSITAIRQFLDMPCVTMYDYYDNTDRPHGISAAAWSARKRRWNELLKSDDIYENALVYEIVRPDKLFAMYTRPSPEQITEHLHKNRVNIANMHTIVHIQNQMESEQKVAITTMSDCIRNYNELRDKLMQGDPTLTKHRDEALAKMPNTWDDCKALLEQAQQALNLQNTKQDEKG